MSDILIIKTSSLGDVIHQMPALTEARTAYPDARFVWVVEEAFAPLVRLHPAVDEVVPVAVRRWRNKMFDPAVWGEISAARRMIRERRYDAVIDTQGLLKSALIAASAEGPRHGYDAASIREPWAARFYQLRHGVPRSLHAVERNRRLTALALGYPVAGTPDFGLDRAGLAGETHPPYAILLHGTAQARKEWPPQQWRELATRLSKTIDVVVPWGTADERRRAEAIADGLDRVTVPPRRPLDETARLMAGASLVVGVDTGLLHLAAALGVPLVAIFCGSDPALTAPVGAGRIALLGKPGEPPSLAAVEAALSRLGV